MSLVQDGVMDVYASNKGCGNDIVAEHDINQNCGGDTISICVRKGTASNRGLTNLYVARGNTTTCDYKDAYNLKSGTGSNTPDLFLCKDYGSPPFYEDVVVLTGQNSLTANYTKVNQDLEEGCGGSTPYKYLAYKNRDLGYVCDNYDANTWNSDCNRIAMDKNTNTYNKRNEYCGKSANWSDPKCLNICKDITSKCFINKLSYCAGDANGKGNHLDEKQCQTFALTYSSSYDSIDVGACPQCDAAYANYCTANLNDTDFCACNLDNIKQTAKSTINNDTVWAALSSAPPHCWWQKCNSNTSGSGYLTANQKSLSCNTCIQENVSNIINSQVTSGVLSQQNTCSVSPTAPTSENNHNTTTPVNNETTTTATTTATTNPVDKTTPVKKSSSSDNILLISALIVVFCLCIFLFFGILAILFI